MKIYTGQGDGGYSSLFSGNKIPKDATVFHAVGDLDEVNANIGLLKLAIQDEHTSSILYAVQNLIFNLGAKIAMESDDKAAGIDEDAVKKLESEIDSMQDRLPPLRTFILPGGTQSAALCHLCRTNARKAERSLVSYGKLAPEELKFINRLSDYFFVLARFLVFVEGGEETIWNKSTRL